jgi:hypothetical protein
MGTSLVAGTVGNHDLDSRQVTRSEEPKEVLQDLNPRFPLPDESLNNEFWARHVTLTEGGEYRLVVLNSCAKHGDGAQREELERGTVSEMTLRYLEERLKKSVARRVNILLCHHHPHAHSELHLGDQDVMRRGQLLIDLLAQQGDWLIVHGHKHHPKISYASGGASWPIVFGAGSLSGMLSQTASTRTRNLFHLVDFIEHPLLTRTPRGTVRTWYWAAGLGWKRADSAGMGLRYLTGFGARIHPRQMAQLIAATFKSFKPPALKTWDELCKRVPELMFQLPQDYELMKACLEREHQLSVVEDRGLPSQVGST